MRARGAALVVATMVGLRSPSVHADDAVRLDATFDRPSLRFAVTLDNAGTATRRLVQVGVRSEVAGDFRCAPVFPADLVLADYLVRFSVRSKETRIAADPVLSIGKGASRYSVSLMPDATGACGAWSARVTTIAVLDDGRVLESTAATISDDDLRALAARQPDRAEIEGGLVHRDAGLRAQAAALLARSSADDATVAKALVPMIDDPVPAVRIAAAGAVAERKLTAAGPALLARLTKVAAALPPLRARDDEGSGEALDEAKALAALHDDDAAGAIASLMANGRFRYAGLLADELDAWPSAPLDRALVEKLTRARAWSLPRATEDQALQYLAMCQVVVAHGAPDARPALEAVLAGKRHPLIPRNVLDAMWEAAEKAPDQPLLVALAPSAAAAVARAPDGDDVRTGGLRFLRTLAPAVAQRLLTEKLLRAVLADHSPYARAEAILAAAAVGAQGLDGALCAADAKLDTSEQADVDAALARLHVSCGSP